MNKCKECGLTIYESSTRRKKIESLVKQDKRYEGLLDCLCVNCINNEQKKVLRNMINKIIKEKVYERKNEKKN